MWEAFVRRMCVALVSDQQATQDDHSRPGEPALDQLKDKQRQTAANIWKSIVKEAVPSKYKSESDLYMWKILVNSVATMLTLSGSETDYGLWEELVGTVLGVLKMGERNASLLMYEYLLGKAKRAALSPEVFKHTLEVMVEFMLSVEASNQRDFVDKVKEVIVKHFWSLYETKDPESAFHLFELLKNIIPKLKGARESLWKELVDLPERLPKDGKGDKMRNDLYRVLGRLNDEEQTDVHSLQKMRATLSSGTWSNESQPGSCTDSSFSGRSFTPAAPDSGIYPMTYQANNRALLINNVDFSDGNKRRDGSEMDELAMTPLLNEKLGCHVQHETNLSKNELYRAIAAFADRPEHAAADVAVLAVMTHGVNEGLMGADGKVLPFHSVIDCFSDEKAPNLAGKPKWLIFQACRTTSEETEHAPVGPGGQKHSDARVADLFITYTTLPGRDALRHPVEGTWYVQALQDVLNLPQAHELSLEDIHKKVQETMSAIWKREMESGRPEEILEEPKLDVDLREWTKKLYFWPVSDP